MGIVAVLCIVLLNAGALLLLAPTNGNRVYEAIGLDPAYREFGGLLLFGGAQMLLLLVVNALAGSLRSEERQYWALRERQQQTETKLAEAKDIVELTWEKPPRFLHKFLRLRKRYREQVRLRREAERRQHRLEVEVAELRQLQAFFDEASEYCDTDKRNGCALLQEVARLRERLSAMVDPETYKDLLAEYNELEKRLAEREKRQPKKSSDVQALENALHGAISSSDGMPMTQDQAVS